MKPPSGLPLIDWSKFKDLPSTRGSLLDVPALRSRLALGLDNPVRRKTAIFRCATDCPVGIYQRIRDGAIKRFVEMMDKDGWDLAGRIQVRESRFAATEPDKNIILEDMKEYTIKADFKQRKFKRVRIELPPPPDGVS